MIENDVILIKIKFKLVHNGPINNNPTMMLIMAWRWRDDKPSSEPMVVKFNDPYSMCSTAGIFL